MVKAVGGLTIKKYLKFTGCPSKFVVQGVHASNLLSNNGNTVSLGMWYQGVKTRCMNKFRFEKAFMPVVQVKIFQREYD